MIDVTTQGPDGHWDIEDIKRLCEYRDQLRAALRRYGRHKLSCPAAGIFSPPENAPYCTCGLEALTAEPQSEPRT